MTTGHAADFPWEEAWRDEERKEAERQVYLKGALQMRGRLQLKIRGAVFGSSWPEVDCEYNPATHKFSSTDSKGKQEIVADCWVVDVPNSSGKKQHRFDVVSNTHNDLWRTASGGYYGSNWALAAAEAAEKQRWLVVMETKQAKQAREKVGFGMWSDDQLLAELVEMEVYDLEAALLDFPRSIPAAAAAAAAAAASSTQSDWVNKMECMEEVEDSDDYDARKKALDAQATVPPLSNALKLSTYITLSESLAIEVRLCLLVLRFLPLSLLFICRGEPKLQERIGSMVTFTTSDAPSSASLLSLRTRTLTYSYLHGSVTG
jgi:hypothetical protein